MYSFTFAYLVCMSILFITCKMYVLFKYALHILLLAYKSKQSLLLLVLSLCIDF